MTDKLKGFVTEALDKYSQGDVVDWDIGSGMQENQLFHVLTLVVPSPVLGESIMAGGMIGGAQNIDQEKLDQMVRQALEQIRMARSQKLNEGLAQAPERPAGGGLIVP